MNGTHDRERIHKAIDRTMGGVTGDPFLHARVMAAAKRKKEGVSIMKYKHLITLALAAVLCLTVAVASELFNGTVDWDGNLTPDAPQPTVSPTMVPEAAKEEIDRSKQQIVFENANRPADGQMAVLYDLTLRDTPNGWNTLNRSVADMHQFESLMAAAEGFVIPVSIPEGYAFEGGWVYYGCKPEGEFRLVKTVDSDDGFRAEFYELDEESAVVTGYQLSFLKMTEDYDPADAETWQMISVYAFLGNGFEESDMYVRDSTGVSAVTVPGMEKAVYIQGVGRDALDMYGVLPQPVTSRSSLFDEAVTEHQISITVWSDASMADTLALFGGK